MLDECKVNRWTSSTLLCTHLSLTSNKTSPRGRGRFLPQILIILICMKMWSRRVGNILPSFFFFFLVNRQYSTILAGWLQQYAIKREKKGSLSFHFNFWLCRENNLGCFYHITTVLVKCSRRIHQVSLTTKFNYYE